MVSSHQRITILLATFLFGSACKTTDTHYCPEDFLDNCDLKGRCIDKSDCSGNKQVCDVSISDVSVSAFGTCVECTATEHAACRGTTPVCRDNTCQGCTEGECGSLGCLADGSCGMCTMDRDCGSLACLPGGSCGKCTTHGDCESAACLPDGTCGSDTNVAYVAPNGTNNVMCTKTVPCTVSAALATSRLYVKFTGIKNEQVSVSSKDVTFLADSGAKLTDTNPGTLLKVDGTSHLTIYDLEIAGAMGANNWGISLQAGNTAVVTLTRVKVTGNRGGGIVALGGTLTVTQSTISSNQGGGISIGGVGATFSLINNFITGNGDEMGADGTIFGGLFLGITVAGTNRLEFNTIVDNKAVINSGGIVCNVATFMGPNNIIAHNSLDQNTTATNAQTLGACMYPSSKVLNDASELRLSGSFKLMLGSTAIDQATTPSDVIVDFEGDARPSGSNKDIGADEYKP